MSAGKESFRNPMNFLAVFLGSLILLTTIGCKKSDAPVDPVVSPPTPVVGAETSSTEPPGSLELPDGAIPKATSDQSTGGRSPASSQDEGIQMPSSAAPVTDGAKQGDPPVLFADWDSIHKAATTNGKITVVDFWSLACEPCLKEFPGLVHLHETLGAKVQCMAVDMDYDGRKTRPPQHYESDVKAFLASVHASGFPTYISSTPSEDVYEATKLISIPAVMIFDASGQVAKVFVDAGDSVGFTYEKDVMPFVTKLVESN